MLSTHDVVSNLFCVKCSGHVYYYVRKLGGGGGGGGKRRRKLFRAGVGKKFEGLVGEGRGGGEEGVGGVAGDKLP